MAPFAVLWLARLADRFACDGIRDLYLGTYVCGIILSYHICVAFLKIFILPNPDVWMGMWGRWGLRGCSGRRRVNHCAAAWSRLCGELGLLGTFRITCIGCMFGVFSGR